ncbi:MAG: hypothetical protein RRY08_06830 [Christensenella sp.]
MINIEVSNEISQLCDLYKETWHTDVLFMCIPTTLSQESLCLVMRRIVNTGESILVGFEKIRCSINTYRGIIGDTEKYKSGCVLEHPCPLCGNHVRYHKNGNSHKIACDTKYCMQFGAAPIHSDG